MWTIYYHVCYDKKRSLAEFVMRNGLINTVVMKGSKAFTNKVIYLYYIIHTVTAFSEDKDINLNTVLNVNNYFELYCIKYNISIIIHKILI